MKKNLDETSIVNELRGQSSFFRSSAATIQPETDRPPDRAQMRPEMRTEMRSELPTVNLPIKRRTKRYSFEFYDDQITRLKQLKRLAEDRGDNLTLSAMVREALDHYLNHTEYRSQDRSH